MAHDLPRLRAASAQAHAVDDVVEAALEQGQQFSPAMPFIIVAFS